MKLNPLIFMVIGGSDGPTMALSYPPYNESFGLLASRESVNYCIDNVIACNSEVENKFKVFYDGLGLTLYRSLPTVTM